MPVVTGVVNKPQCSIFEEPPPGWNVDAAKLSNFAAEAGS